MQFEAVTYNDLNEIRNLQPDGWSDIIPEFEFYIKSTFCNPIKAVINSKIVGIGASIVFDHTSWIAHIIVDSNFRNRGIGFQIVNALLEDLRRYSVDSCLLIATEIGKPVYLKAGFRTVTEYSFLKRESPWKEKPISENVQFFLDEYQSGIYQLDKKISGENREKLLRDYLWNSIVYVENKKVLGYYLPNLKEELIFADNVMAGMELMKFKYSKIDKAVFPSNNTAAYEFLKNNGFAETGAKGTRMILGKDINWKPEKIYSRIGGNLG